MSSTAIPDIDRTHESDNAVDTESTPPAQQKHRLLAEQRLQRLTVLILLQF
jgi:hypothetical protein